MAYTVEPVDVTNTPKERVIDPRAKKPKDTPNYYKWWLADNDKDLVQQLLSTCEFFKRQDQTRIRQASVFTRLFSGKPLYNFLASNATLDNSNQLPIGRPTANVTYSCIDTIVSRISQDQPKPTFLTDGGSYKQRRLAKDANQFIWGELHRTKAYELVPLQFRDGCILGDGLLKVFPRNGKVNIERTLAIECYVDYNDAYYGNPRAKIQRKLVDRSTYMELFPEKIDLIEEAAHGNVDNTPRSTETVSDQFIIAEGWHLPSCEGASDGRHVIACSAGLILDESYNKQRFPFTKIGYNPNPVGYWSQGLAEILMPTQMELYRNLIIASQNIELMGVPRVLVEEMSKILETSFNNRIGSIIKYRNTAPEFVNAQANHPEMYEYIKWLIQNAYQMSGISALSAAGTKPAGLNSGESIREYDDIQNDRFAALAKRYQNIFPDLSELIIDCAQDIYDETGKYSTIFPGKDGTHEIDFKSIGLLKDTYVIQCYEESSLPKDPAGRQAKLSEMLAADEITQQEFRRLSNFPDLEQSDQLAIALEERILYSLDHIIDNGKKDYDKIAPDPFILDPSDLATTLCVNYINKYAVTDLEEEKMQLLRDWFTQVQTLKQQASPPPVPAAIPSQSAGGAPSQALPVQPPNPSIGPASGAQV
jgi:hypothetical protein